VSARDACCVCGKSFLVVVIIQTQTIIFMDVVFTL